MKSIVLLLVAFSVCLFTVQSFFDFLKSSSSSASGASGNVVVTVPNPNPSEFDKFRGIPEKLREHYAQETFVCDNGQTKIPSTAINDGYCDCSDHTDEPGTSACSKGTFHCVNKGYKAFSIPSSRVDDLVCDCCDGSDEGIYVKCPNTCQEMAAMERSALDRMIQTYKLGSQLRKAWETNIREKLEKDANPPADVSVELTQLKQTVAEVDAKIATEESILTQKENEIKNDTKGKINRLLKLSPENLPYIAGFLSALTQSLNIDEMQLVNYLSDSPHSSATRSRSEQHHHQGENGGEDQYDDYDMPPEEPPVNLDESNQKDVVDSCDLTELTGNSLLRVLCDSNNKPAAVISMIHSILFDLHSYTHFMLIAGYYRLHRTMENAGEFAKNYLSNFGHSSCPAEFESLSNFCETRDFLRDFVVHIESVANTLESPELTALKQQKNDFSIRIQELENLETTATRARDDLRTYEGQFPFLFLKGQTFEVEDGKFSYALTVLQNVQQKELHGHNSVTLGNYESLEESTEHGHSYKMKFTNGQYCHAFGARSAEVTVVCGERNVLKSAQEPSTCFYTLVFESPAACTEQFAAANGLLA